MRCVEGDRAVIVGGYRDNIGGLVDIVRESSQPGVWVAKTLCRTLARIDGQLIIAARGTLVCVPDDILWPIRGENINARA